MTEPDSLKEHAMEDEDKETVEDEKLMYMSLVATEGLSLKALLPSGETVDVRGLALVGTVDVVSTTIGALMYRLEQSPQDKEHRRQLGLDD